MPTNYISLIDQKKQLIKKLENLNARQFGATSSGEMNKIYEERKDIRSTLEAIDKLLTPQP